MENTNSGIKPKREWCCERCKDAINIFVPDHEKKYVIDGDKIFCGTHCRQAYRDYIPVKLARGGGPSKYKKVKHQQKEAAKFKCFHCNRESNFMTWDKLCSYCRDSMSRMNHDRLCSGEFITGLVGDLTNEQRSQIRLSKIN